MKILKSLVIVLAMATLAVGATNAYFSDSVTSNGNSFASGTLELNVDGGHTNVVKFNVTNMKPGNQPKGSWLVANVGSINGYLDLENIAVSNQENGCNGAEVAAGDVTCDNPGAGQGELDQVVNLRLFVDRDGDGWIGGGDTVFYNGPVGGVAGNYELNEPINAGNNTTITAILDWWSTPNDNLAQTDSMTIDLTFELAQTTGQ